jgi:hypothetical protein
MDADRLVELDAKGYEALLAIAYGRGPKHGSFAYPHAFVCSDGRTYWVKRFQYTSFNAGHSPPEPGAQRGLVAELVAGRLGHALGAAALARVVEVPAAVLRADGTTGHLQGVGVGLEDQAGMENLRYLADQVPGGTLDPATLNEESVALVIAFQSWLGADDTQIMVDLRSGRMLSIDHGAYTAFDSRLRDQGILDDVIVGLEQRLGNGGASKAGLEELSQTFEHALAITEPEPGAIRGPIEDTLKALYRAYVAPRSQPRRRTKGVVLDDVVTALRRRGFQTHRGHYVGDFIFDVVIEEGPKLTALEVLSFAGERKSWTPIEHDAAHFLYGLQMLGEERGLAGRAVIEPPSNGNGAVEAHGRVVRWLDREGVPTNTPAEITDPQVGLAEFE